jgi:hypothetical protein
MATSTPPGVHLEVHAGERGDAVHHEQGGMAGSVDGPADGLDVVGDAGGSVDLHHEDGLDGMVAVEPQASLDHRRIDGGAP